MIQVKTVYLDAPAGCCYCKVTKLSNCSLISSHMAKKMRAQHANEVHNRNRKYVPKYNRLKPEKRTNYSSLLSYTMDPNQEVEQKSGVVIKKKQSTTRSISSADNVIPSSNNHTTGSVTLAWLPDDCTHAHTHSLPYVP